MRLPGSLPLLAILLPSLALPAILPDTIGDWQKGTPTAALNPDPTVWQEYGLQDSESASYTAHGQTYTISAWRFADATGAYAAMDQVRPKDATSITVTDVGLETAADELVTVGNYLFIFKGYKPKPEELNHVIGTAPRYAQSRIPTLPKHLPPGGVPNSERYIVGPASLAAFAPAISPGTAAFHFDSEAAVARYKVTGGEATLLVFSYPTMEMARNRLPAFQAIPGATVKRAGPLVALTLNTPNPDDAEKLLSQVRYQAEVTVPEHVPTLRDNPANLFLNIIILCSILAALCLVAGLVVGGLRITLIRGGASGDGDAMISLRLSGRS
jgi:hypothetical protein